MEVLGTRSFRQKGPAGSGQLTAYIALDDALGIGHQCRCQIHDQMDLKSRDVGEAKHNSANLSF
jgi:hypothetical protein